MKDFVFFDLTETEHTWDTEVKRSSISFRLTYPVSCGEAGTKISNYLIDRLRNESIR
jgi:hypothetical protein